MLMQKTLVLLKPDALDRGLVGEIIHRFERLGVKIVGLKMVVASEDLAKKHYTEDLAKRRGEKVREIMVSMLTSGPVIALALEGVDAVEVVRKIVGETEPKKAAPGTIRGDFTHVSFEHANQQNVGVFNLIHASANGEDAESELQVWFSESELVAHKPSYTKFTLNE